MIILPITVLCFYQNFSWICVNASTRISLILFYTYMCYILLKVKKEMKNWKMTHMMKIEVYCLLEHSFWILWKIFWSVLFMLYRFSGVCVCVCAQGGGDACVCVCLCVCAYVRAWICKKSPYYKHCSMISTEETENEGKHQIPGFQDGSPKPMMDSSPSNIVRSIA